VEEVFRTRNFNDIHTIDFDFKFWWSTVGGGGCFLPREEKIFDLSSVR
jgi:hypothetical protein